MRKSKVVIKKYLPIVTIAVTPGGSTQVIIDGIDYSEETITFIHYDGPVLEMGVSTGTPERIGKRIEA